jgi:hypothetical protein
LNNFIQFPWELIFYFVSSSLICVIWNKDKRTTAVCILQPKL